MMFSLGAHLCVQISPFNFYKDISYVGLGAQPNSVGPHLN